MKDLHLVTDGLLSLGDADGFFKTFIAAIPAAVAIFDTDLRYIAASARWYADNELDETDIIGRHHYDIFPDIPDHWRAYHNKALAGETLAEEEEPYIRADGRIDYVTWELAPWYDKAGEIGGIIMFTQVVTQSVELRKHSEAHAAKLQYLADHDGLTGLMNRRRFLEELQAQSHMLQRYGAPCCLALIDLDHFKKVNDTYGHAFGDRVLQGFAKLSGELLRPTDYRGRIGGEEFAFLLPHTQRAGGASSIKRFLTTLAAHPFDCDGQPVHVTASAGMLSLQPDDRLPDEILERADKALYLAKSNGRNRLEMA